MESLERVLRQHPFFAGLDERCLAMLVGCAANQRYAAGDYLFREGGEAERFYLVRDGHVTLQVETPARGAIPIETLGPGDVFGWSWLIPPYRWRLDARAANEARVFAMDGTCLRAKCEQDHALGYEVMRRFSAIVQRRLDATRRQLIEIHSAYCDLVEGRT